MELTTEQINAALDQVRESLKNPAFWEERVKQTELGIKVIEQNAVVDRSKLHEPITI